jgi:hypothetical protein
VPTLTLDVGGPNEMDLDCERGGHAAPRKVGGKGNSASGSEWSQIRAELMVVPFVTAPLPWDTIATIRSLFALGARVNCAGDVFNKPGTIVCSGTITDDLHETGDRGTVNGTLYEIAATPTYTPATTLFLLTSVESPDSGGDPTILVSTPDGSYPGDTPSNADLLSGITVVSTALVDPTTPDLSFLSVPLNAGLITGVPYVQFETAMTGVFSGTTVWAVMDVMAKIYQMRGASIIAGPFSTGYAGVGLGGGLATLTASGSVILTIQTGDQMLVELYPRLQLQPLQSDNGQRQSVDFGAVPGPRPLPLLVVGGNLTSAP